MNRVSDDAALCLPAVGPAPVGAPLTCAAPSRGDTIMQNVFCLADAAHRALTDIFGGQHAAERDLTQLLMRRQPEAQWLSSEIPLRD